MKSYRSVLSAVLASLALAFAASAADERKPDKGLQSPMALEIARKGGAEFEAAYLGLMTLHHQGGIKMAKLAVEKAQNPELKEMMKKSISQQEKEIEQMTAWLQEWHTKAPSDFHEPRSSREQMQKDMQELKKLSGKEFDEAFEKKMARHHLGAIEMGKLAGEKALHGEVKASGEKIATTQTAERKKLLAMSHE